VLELAGAGDVDVAVGSHAPLVAPLRTAISHGPDGLGYAELPVARRALSSRFAPDLLVEEARRRPGAITLVATGPLTNVALALARFEPPRPLHLGRPSLQDGSESPLRAGLRGASARSTCARARPRRIAREDAGRDRRCRARRLAHARHDGRRLARSLGARAQRRRRRADRRRTA